MRAYGASRWYLYGGFAEIRVPQQRSNRGRNRTLAKPWNKLAFDRPTRRETRIRRALRKRDRQRAQAEVSHDLHLWWLERKLQNPTKSYKKSSEYAYLKEVATQEEIDHLQYEEYLERKMMNDLLYQEDNWYTEDYCWDYYDNDYDHELDYQGYYEPNPDDPEWRDAWVQGEVHHEGLEERCELASPSDYDDLDDYEYDPQEWYRAHREATIPCPSLRLDSERNQERLRSGERFYSKYELTVPPRAGKQEAFHDYLTYHYRTYTSLASEMNSIHRQDRRWHRPWPWGYLRKWALVR